MATQTRGQVQTEISNLIAILHDLLKAASINSSGNISNYIARESTFFGSTDGDFTNEGRAALAGARASLNATLSRPTAAAMLTPLFRNYMKVEGFPETDIDAIFDRLSQDFIDNSRDVNSRNITHGSPSAGSNIGDGVINRLTVTKDNMEIENIHLEAHTAECIADQNTGGAVEHEEVFEFRGTDREIDELAITGSGIRDNVTALSARNSLIRNSSFSNFSGTTTVPTGITSWTVGSSINNFQIDETNTYRGFQGDSTPRSVIFETNDSLTQAFSVNSVTFDAKTPIYCQLAYNREVGTCDGRLTLTCGNNTVDVVLAAQTGWNILRVPIASTNWPENFADGDGLGVRVELTGRTTGTLRVDDVLVVPYTNSDNTWYAIVGGATPFVAQNHDTFTWTDSLAATDSILQRWFWRAFDRMLPHVNDGSETWADPSV